MCIWCYRMQISFCRPRVAISLFRPPPAKSTNSYREYRCCVFVFQEEMTATQSGSFLSNLLLSQNSNCRRFVTNTNEPCKQHTTCMRLPRKPCVLNSLPPCKRPRASMKLPCKLCDPSSLSPRTPPWQRPRSNSNRVTQ